MDALSGIGIAVSKAIFKAWFKDHEFLSSLSESLADLIGTAISDRRVKAAAERQLSRIAERVSDSLESLIDTEWPSLPSHERQAALISARDAIEQTHITARLLAELDYDVDALSELVVAKLSTIGLSQAAATLAQRVAGESCDLVIETAAALPGFHRENYAEILLREARIIERVDKVFEAIEVIREYAVATNSEQAGKRFEEAYRRSAARNLDKIELFGLDAGIKPSSKQHNLSTAYISLSVSGPDPASAAEHPDAPSTQEASADSTLLTAQIEQIINQSPRIFIKGEAGSGKTTLLQSLAVRAASARFGEELADWNDLIPFFVRLRALSSEDPPSPEQLPNLIAPAIAGTMPTGWVHDQLAKGRGLLLVDGLDEISSERREKTRNWIAEILAEYPHCRVIITSRPPAVPDGWLGAQAFSEFEMLPMSPDDVGLFIDHWHEAVAQEELNQIKQHELLELAPALRERIRGDRSLRELAATPLLCAMLCAMNRDRRQALPSSRLALYEAVVQTVLHNRDDQRKIRTDLPKLTYEVVLALMQEIAFWMMQNGWSMTDTWRLAEFIEGRLPSFTKLPPNATPTSIVDLLILRSGLLRSPIEGKFDFIHNAFKEYLCSRAVASGDRLDFLLSNISNEAWREVAVLAAASTDDRRRNQFLQEVIARGDASPSKRAMYHLLAVRCLETCTNLDPDVQALIKDRIQHLRPPSSITEARALSAAGDLAIPLLTRQYSKPARTDAACVRALRLIGSETALEALEGYGPDTRTTVAREVWAAWPFFDRSDFAKRVLADSPGIRGIAAVESLDALMAAQYLKKVLRLRIFLREKNIDPAVFSVLSGLCQLSLLDIRSPGVVNIDAVHSLQGLRTLVIDAKSIGAIGSLPVFSELTHLNLISHQSLEIDLSALPEKIENLYLTGDKLKVDLPLGHESKIVNLHLRGLAAECDVHWVRRMPRLRDITFGTVRLDSVAQHIRFPEAVHSLYFLNNDGLETLESLSSFRNLKSIRLSNARDLRDISVLENMIDLESVYIRGAASLENLDSLFALPKLKQLTLDVKGKIDIDQLRRTGSLQSFVISAPRFHQGGDEAAHITALRYIG